jgi:hypothetical protein
MIKSFIVIPIAALHMSRKYWDNPGTWIYDDFSNWKRLKYSYRSIQSRSMGIATEY